MPPQAASILEAYFDVEDGEVENLAPQVDANAGTYTFGGPMQPAGPGNGAIPSSTVQQHPSANLTNFNFGGTPMS